MARVDDLRVPLLGRLLRATGDVMLRAELLLVVADTDQDWHLLPFRSDSGTEITTMQAALARHLKIPLPRHPTPELRIRTVTGQESPEPVRAGAIKVRFFGIEESEFWFPCYFVGDPQARVSGQPGRLPRSFLGLTGVIDKLAISFDGRPREDALYGNVIVQVFERD
jgi:hypothetical protein